MRVLIRPVHEFALWNCPEDGLYYLESTDLDTGEHRVGDPTAMKAGMEVNAWCLRCNDKRNTLIASDIGYTCFLGIHNQRWDIWLWWAPSAGHDLPPIVEGAQLHRPA